MSSFLPERERTMIYRDTRKCRRFNMPRTERAAREQRITRQAAWKTLITWLHMRMVVRYEERERVVE
jgi:hypothetical protein